MRLRLSLCSSISILCSCMAAEEPIAVAPQTHEAEVRARLGMDPVVARRQMSQRVDRAAEVYMTLVPQVPLQALESARCIAVVPNVRKAAFILGGRTGNGVASCRTATGRWSKLEFVQLDSEYIGLQIGVERRDLLLLFMTERAVQLLKRGRFALNAEAGASVGEAHHGTQRLNTLFTDIVAFSKARGAFAGFSLGGTVMSRDDEAHVAYYGTDRSWKPLERPIEKGKDPSSDKLIELFPSSTVGL